MNIEDIRSKTDSELDFELKSVKKELFGLRIKASAETLANSAQIRVLRRSIARMNTVLHERATGVRGQESL
ncbi:MAG: large subunit ribosomal protein L29 [Candidatus Paceibacteria bacterium]|jgi:large subunit ribosomal protein L29